MSEVKQRRPRSKSTYAMFVKSSVAGDELWCLLDVSPDYQDLLGKFRATDGVEHMICTVRLRGKMVPKTVEPAKKFESTK